ncbi:MAG: UDP-glucose/GDP-mannose dehydrogenase family protein [Planctomycetes bacterium]|nr:UDP-glucose/GDP-mannose dehydrogenase family protein [Planctomycetota bacterium]
MTITLIGTGHVGLVTGACLAAKGHRVVCVDNNHRKINLLRSGRIPIYEPGLEKLVRNNRRKKRLFFSTNIRTSVIGAEVIFIAVGTPLGRDGAADLSQVKRVARTIAPYLKNYTVIVEKSTAPVSTGAMIKNIIKKYIRPGVDFDVVSNPEFLQEGTAVKTTLYPDRIVLGVESKKAEKIMRRVYRRFKAPIVITDLNSAELIKHASNAFLAMKISYVNALANICELAKADITHVARGIGMDKRINPYFLNAGIGYGGYCLPKDVVAFAKISEQVGYKFNLLREVQKINLDQRHRFIKKIARTLRGLKGKRIGLLGLSFKPQTDDIRESPGIDIAQRLSQHGARVKAYDPKAMPGSRNVLPKKIRFAKNINDAARGSDALVIATDWPQFKKINLPRLKKIMARPVIIDGRNIFSPARMRRSGFTYVSIGRK